MTGYTVSVTLLTLLYMCHIIAGLRRHSSETVELVDGCERLKNHVDDVDTAFKEKFWFTNRIYVNSSVRVILSRNHLQFKREEQYYCKVAFETRETGYRILLSWESFTVGERRNTHDWLQVVDLQSTLPLSDEMWGAMGVGTKNHRPPPTSDYRSIGHGLVLQYKGHPYDDAVAVILTVFRDLNAVNQCGPGYLKCIGNHPLCIDDSLQCNGDNNCGDSNRSDEDSDCNPNPWVNNNVPPITQSSTPVGLIGALSGIFVTGILIATVGCMVLWYKKRRQRRRFVKSKHQPRSIESLAQNGRVAVSSNTYTQLPQNVISLGKNSDHHLMDFSHPSDISPITLDGDSSESLLRSPAPTDVVNREGVTFNQTAAGGEPAVRYTNSNQIGGVSNGACGQYGPDGQIYYYMDDVCPLYHRIS